MAEGFRTGACRPNDGRSVVSSRTAPIKTITAKDVARVAETSTAVVSYVFNNGPRNVSVATRERVLAAAAELGYQPNALARALSAGKTKSIGLIVPNICNAFFAESARAIEDAAAERDHVLLIGDSAMNQEHELRHVSSFIERKVDSVILVSLLSEPDLEAFHRAGIPVVVLHPIADETQASTLSIDFELAAQMATTHLVDHGYETIGLLNGPVDSAGSRQHRAGFDRAILAATQAGRTLPVSHRHCEISRAEAAEVMAGWLASDDRPRAVYVSTDEQAFGVLYAAHRAGLSVPEDLAVIGFDGTANSAYSVPALSTVKHPTEERARRAVEILVDRDPEAPPVHELLDFTFIARRSCGCED